MREIHTPPQPEVLTEREIEVLRLLAVDQANSAWPPAHSPPRDTATPPPPPTIPDIQAKSV